MVCKQPIEHEEIISQIKVSSADTARHVSQSYSPLLQCLVLGTSMLRCYPAKSNLEDGQPLLQSEAKTGEGGQRDDLSSRRPLLVYTLPRLFPDRTHRFVFNVVSNLRQTL